MPPDVERAGVSPIPLPFVLKSGIYKSEERSDIVERLTRSLVSRYCDVWVQAGKKEVSILAHVNRFRKDPPSAVEMLYGIEEYGGRDGVDAVLAREMQPGLLSWWEKFEWRDAQTVQSWTMLTMPIIGARQYSWLAAQYARTVLGNTSGESRELYIELIESAERQARSFSDADYRASSNEAKAAYLVARAAMSDAWKEAGISRSRRATSDAYAANAVVSVYENAFNVPNLVVESSVAAGTRESATEAYAHLAAIARKLFTPTLITDAVASGATRAGAVSGPSMIPAAVVGVVLGAGAMHFAKRR